MKTTVLLLFLAAVSVLAADVTITIPDPQLSRVLDGIATSSNYDAYKLPAETKAQFARRMMIAWVKAQVLQAEQRAARIQADASAEASVTAIGIN
jgi:hypothetical protein